MIFWKPIKNSISLCVSFKTFKTAQFWHFHPLIAHGFSPKLTQFDRTKQTHSLKGLLKSYWMHVSILKLDTANSSYKLSKIAPKYFYLWNKVSQDGIGHMVLTWCQYVDRHASHRSLSQAAHTHPAHCVWVLAHTLHIVCDVLRLVYNTTLASKRWRYVGIEHYSNRAFPDVGRYVGSSVIL